MNDKKEYYTIKETTECLLSASDGKISKEEIEIKILKKAACNLLPLSINIKKPVSVKTGFWNLSDDDLRPLFEEQFGKVEPNLNRIRYRFGYINLSKKKSEIEGLWYLSFHLVQPIIDKRLHELNNDYQIRETPSENNKEIIVFKANQDEPKEYKTLYAVFSERDSTFALNLSNLLIRHREFTYLYKSIIGTDYQEHISQSYQESEKKLYSTILGVFLDVFLGKEPSEAEFITDVGFIDFITKNYQFDKINVDKREISAIFNSARYLVSNQEDQLDHHTSLDAREMKSWLHIIGAFLEIFIDMQHIPNAKSKTGLARFIHKNYSNIGGSTLNRKFKGVEKAASEIKVS